MSRCVFDTGDYCEYLSDAIREDEPAQECNVPNHQKFCLYFRQDKSPDPVLEILREYADDAEEVNSSDDGEELILVNKNGEPVND